VPAASVPAIPAKLAGVLREFVRDTDPAHYAARVAGSSATSRRPRR